MSLPTDSDGPLSDHRRSSVDRKPRSQGSFGGYKNLVSMEDMPSLFTAFDGQRGSPVRGGGGRAGRAGRGRIDCDTRERKDRSGGPGQGGSGIKQEWEF